MWGQGRDWLKAGGALDPKDTVLYYDLISPETVARLDGKIQIESKNDMKARGIPSPGRGDALMLSFAFPVQHKHAAVQQTHGALGAAQREYDPFAHMSADQGQQRTADHDPFGSFAVR